MSAVAAKAGRAATEAATAKATSVASGPKKVRIRSAGKATYAPVATTLTVLFGIGFLRAWLGGVNDKGQFEESKAMPHRAWWVNMAILGFSLSLMSEVAPRLGKNMAYLVLTTGVFIQAEPLIKRLQEGGEGKPQPRPQPNTQPASPLPGKRTRA